MIAITIAFFGILGAFLSTPVYATTVTWTGLDDGSSWSHQNNWSTHSVPVGSDTIIIDGNSSVNSLVKLDMDFTLSGTLVLQQGDVLVVNSGNTLTITSAGQVKNAGGITPYGTLSNSGIINNTGGLSNFGSISNTGTINGTGGISTNVGSTTNNLGKIFFTNMYNDGTFSNGGTLTVSTEFQNTGGVITNNSPGIITVLQGFGTDGPITNSGTINLEGPLGYQNYNDATFTNSGTINNSGTLYNDAGDYFQSGFIHNTGIINNNGVLINRHLNISFQTVPGTITNEVGGIINNNNNLATVNPGTIDNGGTINNLGALNNYCLGIYNNYDPGFKGLFGVIYYNPITTIPCTSSTININSVSNSSPRWSIDPISVSGTVTGFVSGDTVTISWGDGSSSGGNSITGGSWGPVIHSYPSSAISTNPNQIVATLRNSTNAIKATSGSSPVNVQPHHTQLVVSTKNTPWSIPTSFVATLTDADNIALPVSGKLIHFNGTGVIGVADATTNSSGISVGVGSAPSSIKNGWTYQVHFAGDMAYIKSDSATQKYNTLKHSTTTTLTKPINIPWGQPISFYATLKDASAKSALSGKIIHFNGTGVIGVADVTTNATGIAKGLGNAPNTVATGWKAEATYTQDSLYLGSHSTILSYNTLQHSTSLTLNITPGTVIHGNTYSLSGILKDSTLALPFAGKTVSFTTDNVAVVISPTITNSTGGYLISGLVAPSLPSGTMVHITAKYAGDSLYKSVSVIKTLKVT